MQVFFPPATNKVGKKSSFMEVSSLKLKCLLSFSKVGEIQQQSTVITLFNQFGYTSKQLKADKKQSKHPFLIRATFCNSHVFKDVSERLNSIEK